MANVGKNPKRNVSRQLPDSALRYVLQALIPYSHANLTLSFRPSQFFNDLEAIDQRKKYKRQTLRNVYYSAKRQKLITIDQSGRPQLSITARQMLQPYRPKILSGATVIAIFDIPEAQRNKRTQLRTLLRELKFRQVQQSVWQTKLDCIKVLQPFLEDLEVTEYVELYEAVKIWPRRV